MKPHLTLLFKTFLFILSFSSHGQNVIINEFMASNETVGAGDELIIEDWIELYNTGTQSVNIGGYYISDNDDELEKFSFPEPTIIAPNEYLLLISSGENSNGDEIHIDFSISKSGEALFLVAPNGSTILDSISFGKQRADISMGRNPANLQEWRYLQNPTPGEINDFTVKYDEILESPTFSINGGFYTNPFDLFLSSSVNGSSIYYTLDGSIPDVNNLSGTTYNYKSQKNGGWSQDQIKTHLYNNAIYLSDRSGLPNESSVKGSSYNYSDLYFPDSLIKKGTTIRAITVKPNALTSDVITNTYFFFQANSSLPVISVSLSDKDLFDYSSGIYTPGWYYEVYYDPNNPNYFCARGNYSERGEQWRRLGNFEYFNNGQQVNNVPVEVAIHGGCSRTLPRKTLRLYADDRFEQSFFSDLPSLNPKRILLRNSGNDWAGTLFKDALYHDLVKSMNMAKQKSSASVVYVNSEYWGIHNIRERIDKYFIDDHFEVGTDDLDVIQNGLEVEEGTYDTYQDLKDFLYSNNFQGVANYDSLKSLVDEESLIDYYIAEIFSGNGDWIVNNMRTWRYNGVQETNEVNKYKDGKWRWILFDLDHGMGSLFSQNHNTLDFAINSGHPGSLVFTRFMQNQSFKNKFIIRYTDLLNTVFKTSHTLSLLDNYRLLYEPEIEEHIKRWNYPSSKSQWDNEVNVLKNFYQIRPATQFSQLKSELNLGDLRDLTVNVNNEEAGFIIVNTIDIKSSTDGVDSTAYPWSGSYFDGININLIAIVEQGYKFSHWIKNGSYYSGSTELNILLSANDTYEAIFEEDFTSVNPNPTAYSFDPCGYQFLSWDEESPSGSFPSHMTFVFMDMEDPLLQANIDGFTNGSYDYSSKTRINGLDDDGISFINTGSERPGYPATKLGGAILALNTSNHDSISVHFKAGTVKANNREYNLRLQYRVGDKLPFKDFLNENNVPVEYQRSNTEGSFEAFDLVLPAELMNQPYVQLFWRYYFTDVRNESSGGSRDEIRLDDIKLDAKFKINTVVEDDEVHDMFSEIEANNIINPGIKLELEAGRSINLDPGFETNVETVFSAEIIDCPN